MRPPHEFESPSCREVGGDWWFPERGQSSSATEFKFALQICNSCIHRAECAEWGIQNERHGIWGGLVERQRQALRYRRGIKLREDSIA